MSQFAHELIAAPRGMDSASDIAALAPDMARLLVGLYETNDGRLTAPHNTYFFFNNVGQAGRIDGVGGYNGVAPALPSRASLNDHVWYVQNGRFHKLPVAIWRGVNNPAAFQWCAPYDGTSPATAPPMAAVAIPNKYSGAPFATKARVRSVQYRTELILTQEGGCPAVRYNDGTLAAARPWRFNGTDLFLLGMEAPSVAGTHTAAVIAGGSQMQPATYILGICYLDELGRESDIALYTVTTSGGNQTFQFRGTPFDPQDAKVRLYRTVAGGQVLYRINNSDVAVVLGTQWTLTDDGTSGSQNTTDALLQGNALAPLVGENAVPANASLCAIHKSRIWLNNSAAPNDVQCSNTDLPTQFNVLANPNLPTDGATFRVGADPGDEVTGLFSFGSLLGIFKRKSYFQLWDDVFGTSGAQPFILRPVLTRGCIAPDTIVRCDNVVCFLSEDGVYAMSFEDGFTVTKFSGPLDNHFKSYTITGPVVGGGFQSFFPPDARTTVYNRSQRSLQAIGWHVQNRYHVAIPPYVYMWSFAAKSSESEQVGGWSEIEALYPSLPAYSCASVFLLEREVPLVLYATQDDGGSAPVIYTDTWFDYYGGSNFALGPHFLYRTRAVHGGKPARTQRKRLHKVTVYGQWKGVAVDPKQMRPLLPIGTGIRLTASADDVYTETYDTLYYGGNDGAGGPANPDDLLLRSWYQQRILVQQEYSANMVGYVFDVQIEGNTPYIEINQVLVEFEILS